MKIQDIPIYAQDDRGIIYRCEPVNYIVRKKGTISANHTHKEAETLYLLEGEVEVTIDKEIQKVKAPKMFYIPSNVYHKVVALTDIRLIRGEN